MESRLGYFNSTDGNYDGACELGEPIDLSQDQTIYLAVKPNSNVSSVSIKAERIEIEELWPYSGESFGYYLGKGETKYLKFNIDQHATWWFNVDAFYNSAVSVEYSRDMSNFFTSAGGGKNVKILHQELNAGDYFYIKLTGTADATSDEWENVYVGAAVEQYILDKGDNSLYMYIYGNESKTLKFTANSDEKYSFQIDYYDWSNSNVSAKLTDEEGREIACDSRIDDYSLELSTGLTSGQVVYLTIYNNGTADDCLDIYGFSIKSSRTYELTLNNPVTASLSSCGRNYFYFTPEESTDYCFRADYDNIYSIESYGLGDYSDGFNVSVYIEAGETVCLITQEYENEEVPSYTVWVEKCY